MLQNKPLQPQRPEMETELVAEGKVGEGKLKNWGGKNMFIDTVGL